MDVDSLFTQMLLQGEVTGEETRDHNKFKLGSKVNICS